MAATYRPESGVQSEERAEELLSERGSGDPSRNVRRFLEENGLSVGTYVTSSEKARAISAWAAKSGISVFFDAAVDGCCCIGAVPVCIMDQINAFADGYDAGASGKFSRQYSTGI